MLDLNSAYKVVKKNLPDGDIQVAVEHLDNYIFQVFFDDPSEGQMDPFYKVNKFTGEFKDFSVLTDGDMETIFDLLMDAKAAKNG